MNLTLKSQLLQIRTAKTDLSIPLDPESSVTDSLAAHAVMLRSKAARLISEANLIQIAITQLESTK